MHLIVVLDPVEMAAWARAGDPQVLRWNAALAPLQPAWHEQLEEDTLNDAAERAVARLVLGRPLRAEDDGRLPLTAWRRAEPGAWGCLTPAHGLVASDQITLVPPSELALGTQESHALYEAVQPLFVSEGVELQWHSALQWHVRHDSLRGLPCAGIGRVSGGSVQRWQGRTPLAAARLMRRLQNEAQMVLHEHPVNRDRQDRGLLPVNTLWLSACGAAGDLEAEPPLSDMPFLLGQTTVGALGSAPLPPNGAPDLNEALDGWLRCLPGPAAQTAMGLPQMGLPHLVLCSASRVQSFTPRPPASSAWERWRRQIFGGARPLSLRDGLLLLQDQKAAA